MPRSMRSGWVLGAVLWAADAGGPGRAGGPESSAAAPAAIASVAPLRVPLRVVRFAATGGRILAVSNGIPLPPGALRAADVGRVHVRVAGVEAPVYVRALLGTHPDGSLRSVLVQFRTDFGAETSRAAVLDVGAPRAAALSLPDSVTSGTAPLAAAALPSDPAYLVRTLVVGPTRTAERSAELGAPFLQYDRAFGPAADTHWAAEGDSWENNYYDRAQAYFAQWVRTGNATYFLRGVRQAEAYRRGYLEANKYLSSPHWAQLQGLEEHYLLTGDEASRTAVARVAEVLWGFVYRGNYREWDQRINGRVLLAQVLARRLAAPPGELAPRDWGQRIEASVGQMAAWQRPDGSFDTGTDWCHGQANYMVGVLNDALIESYRSYRADPRALQVVRRAADYLWRTQWNAGAGAFQYVNLVCRSNTTDPSGDLNGLMVAPYGWLAETTGDDTYRRRGDEVFAGLVRNAYLAGSKQFNQAYALSFKYLGYR